jgi:hypothetical protein
MNCLLFQSYVALWSLLMGIFLPFFGFGRLGHFINFFWSVIYGLGLLLCEVAFESERRLIVSLGGLVWPLLVSSSLFWAAGKFWERASLPQRRAYVVVIFLTGFIVNLTRQFDYLDFLPTYRKLMFVAW